MHSYLFIIINHYLFFINTQLHFSMVCIQSFPSTIKGKVVRLWCTEEACFREQAVLRLTSGTAKGHRESIQKVWPQLSCLLKLHSNTVAFTFKNQVCGEEMELGDGIASSLSCKETVQATGADGLSVRKHHDHPLSSPVPLCIHTQPQSKPPSFSLLGLLLSLPFSPCFIREPHTYAWLNSWLLQKCILLWFRALVKSHSSLGILNLKGFTKSTYRFGALSIPGRILHQ